MLVFPDGRRAVACGLEIAKQAIAEPRFRALRIGADVGSMLYREGDYVGTSVNLAARVTSAAQRNQFLITHAVRRQLGDLEVDVPRHSIAEGPRRGGGPVRAAPTGRLGDQGP